MRRGDKATATATATASHHQRQFPAQCRPSNPCEIERGRGRGGQTKRDRESSTLLFLVRLALLRCASAIAGCRCSLCASSLFPLSASCSTCLLNKLQQKFEIIPARRILLASLARWLAAPFLLHWPSVQAYSVGMWHATCIS